LFNPLNNLAIRREEFRLNRSSELLRLSDLGLSPNESNIALWGKRQKEIDKSFQDSATPVFYAMLTLSVATFCAAFIQVNEGNLREDLKIYTKIFRD